MGGLFCSFVPGSYCGATGLIQVSGPCGVGHYCPGGQATASPSSYICPEGYYCPSGSHEPVMCPRGG